MSDGSQLVKNCTQNSAPRNPENPDLVPDGLVPINPSMPDISMDIWLGGNGSGWKDGNLQIFARTGEVNQRNFSQHIAPGQPKATLPSRQMLRNVKKC